MPEGIMPEQTDNWQEGLKPRLVDEIEYIIDAFRCASDGRIRIKPARGDHRIDYLYAEGQILVRDEYLGQVLGILEPETDQDEVRTTPGRLRRVIAGVTLLTLAGERFPTVLEALEEIDRLLGRGIATPDHVLTVAGEGIPCPATEPQEAYDEIEPYPSVCPDGGGGVLIYMDDTGLLTDAATHSWLAGVDAGNVDPGNGQEPIPPYTGHGTFVAGVLRCMAPAADVIVTNVFDVAGSRLESDWIPRLEAALGLGADIFHLTVSTHTRHDHPLITFQKWLSHLREYGGVICVVAAGNDSSRRPSWPAAFSEVVSVGALARDWRSRASFSNFGGWVDVYAPGRDLINAYATGTYVCQFAPYAGKERHFYGMAKWSGTSFSTPIVTGLIAARMSRTGENGRQAAAALLAEARRAAIPGVGPILLPSCGGQDACGKRAECGCGCGGQPRCRDC
jgi:subtilase family protein